MKNRFFLLMAVIAVLAVSVISCTPTSQISDYPNGPVYNSSPYGNNVIVVERDPYTGRYYQVNPNGTYLNDTYYNPNPYYNGYGTYGGRSRYYSNRYYDRRVYNGTTSGNTEIRREPTDQERQQAKDKLFGRRN
jgi:hypothetical protein